MLLKLLSLMFIFFLGAPFVHASDNGRDEDNKKCGCHLSNTCTLTPAGQKSALETTVKQYKKEAFTRVKALPGWASFGTFVGKTIAGFQIGIESTADANLFKEKLRDLPVHVWVFPADALHKVSSPKLYNALFELGDKELSLSLIVRNESGSELDEFTALIKKTGLKLLSFESKQIPLFIGGESEPVFIVEVQGGFGALMSAMAHASVFTATHMGN